MSRFRPWNNGIGPNDVPCPGCGMWGQEPCCQPVEPEEQEDEELNFSKEDSDEWFNVALIDEELRQAWKEKEIEKS